MSYNAFTLPNQLQGIELAAVIRNAVNDDAKIAYVNDLFGAPEVVNPGLLDVEIFEKFRGVRSGFSSQPDIARKHQLDAISRVVTNPIVQDDSFVIDDLLLSRLRMVVGESSPREIMDLAQKASELLMDKTLEISKLQHRTWAQYLYKLLSTSTVSYTVDGVARSESNPWGIKTATASSSWETAATNLSYEYDRMMELFEDNSDGPATHILVPRSFGRDVIAGNTNATDFLVSNAAFQGLAGSSIAQILGAGRALDSNQGEPALEVHRMDLTVETAPGTKTNAWPDEYICVVHEPKISCKQWTARMLQNDMNGGQWSYDVETGNPKRIERVVHHNGIAGFTRPWNVMLFKYVP